MEKIDTGSQGREMAVMEIYSRGSSWADFYETTEIVAGLPGL